MSLGELVGAADAHNHALPTRTELAAALGNLVAAGFVETTDRGFRTTKHGVSLKRRWTGGMFSWGSLLPELQRTTFPSVDLHLTDTEVDAAYADYRRRSRA